MIINSNAKRILCFGDSLTFGKVPGEVKRFPINERWPGILQTLLGEDYEVIEEGLRGRTTNLDNPTSKGRNGLPYFYSCVLSHLPLDLIIILLGTNDLKSQFNRSAEEIASVLKAYKPELEDAVSYLEEKLPKVLIVAPPLVDESFIPKDWDFQGAEDKSKEFGKYFEKVAREISAEFLNTANFLTSSNIDGIHLDKENNQKLAEKLSVKIKDIFINDRD
jgi:lysophospholipase L1-like esterase